jgi:hypothetical protein
MKSDMEDSSEEESYMSESDSSYDGRVRSNRGSVTQPKKRKSVKLQPTKRRIYLKKEPAYQKLRFIEKAGKLRVNDVILGRGPSVCNHEGNILFRFLCHLARPVYVSSGKRWKTDISNLVVKQIASLDPPGRYVESGDDRSTLYLVPKDKVLEKTGQALRESKMSCPPDFLGVARRLEKGETKEEKAKFLASCTGIDLKTTKEVQVEMDLIIEKGNLSVSYMGNTPGIRSTDEDQKADSEAPPAQKTSHASRDSSSPAPRSHGPKKAVVERTLAIETGTKRAASKSASRKSPLKPKSGDGNVSSKAKSTRREVTSKRGTKTRPKSSVNKKPVKKRPVVVANDDPKPVVPSKRPDKSAPRLSCSKPREAPSGGGETPERKHWMPRKLPTKSMQDSKPFEKSPEKASDPSAMRDDEAFSTQPPSLTAFLSGVFSSGASAGSCQTPPRTATAQGTHSGPAKKRELGEASPPTGSILSPKLSSPMSGMYGPNHQEWLAAMAKNQECLSGTTMDAASLLPPQLSSILSGMFGDAIDLKNFTTVEEALELLPPTLANRLSCTLLTPMHSSFFASGAKSKEVPSPPKGTDGASLGGLKQPSESTTMLAYHDRARGEAKPSAGGIVTGVSVTEWSNDRLARLYDASPATVVGKSAGAVAGSAKTARSLLDDDGDDDIADEKVQAARRLSFGRDLYHHNDQPL